MDKYLKLANKTASRFSLKDWMIFETSIVLIGTMVGMTYKKACKELLPLIFITFVCSYTWVLLRMFIVE